MLPHWRSIWVRGMDHLSTADIPPTIISLGTSESESKLEFFSEKDLDTIS
jgi:hypothetical protein